MNFLVPLDFFQIENVQFLKIKKNIVLENSFFVKMIYSDENIVMNGIYLDIPILTFSGQEKCEVVPLNFNNYQRHHETQKNFFFDVLNEKTENGKTIAKIIEIENEILQYYMFITQNTLFNKKAVFSLKTQLEKGFIKWGFSKKTFPKTIQHICLKISGIWENNKEFGINYKFIPF